MADLKGAAAFTDDGIAYRDLNGNGVMDVYEDPRAPVAERVEDLIGRMTLEEKVGLLFHSPIVIGRQGRLVEGFHPMSPARTSELVSKRHLTHFNIMMGPGPEHIARWHNALQRLAERTRLGIPVTVSSDPRHAPEFNPAAGVKQEGFSQWPSQLGLGATRDEGLVERYGDIARREFRAVGLRTVLNPMADVATEPRWGRAGGCFGEDAELVGRLTAAYIRGFQAGGDGLGVESVSCVAKHFPGGGPVKGGSDPHFAEGAEQIYPGDNFDYHLEPFRRAIESGVRQVMVSYGIPTGQTSERVAMAFNREIVTDLLRDRLGFDGVILTDWMTVTTQKILGFLELKPASAWGMEGLSVSERYEKALSAGIDQFGGESVPAPVIELVRRERVAEVRIDDSVRRILRVKFELGLFDDPYVDEDLAATETGTAEFVSAGREAQRRSLVLLLNKAALPGSGRPKLYLEGVDAEVARRYGEIVGSPRDADLAIIRRASPKQRKWSRYLLQLLFPHGSLAFPAKELDRILQVCRQTPTVVDVRFDRPPVIPEIAEEAAAVFATFGSTDEILLDAVFGKFAPTGKLPVDAPSSMAAVEGSREDAPRDTMAPLFRFGHGLTYS